MARQQEGELTIVTNNVNSQRDGAVACVEQKAVLGRRPDPSPNISDVGECGRDSDDSGTEAEEELNEGKSNRYPDSVKK